MFEVSAKKQSTIWKTETYKQPEFRGDVTQTFNRGTMNYDNEIADKMLTNKFNRKVTVISEYSNAMHNNRVFKNPRFTSC